MTKKEFIKQFASDLDLSFLTLPVREKLVDSLLDTIVSTLTQQDEINFPGFGKFSTKLRAARTGRNPSTGQEMQIPEKTVIVFKPASKFAEAVNKKETVTE